MKKRYFRFIVFIEYGYQLYTSWYDMEQIDVPTALRFAEYTARLGKDWEIEYKDKLSENDELRILRKEGK